jgi:curved DNA-binding protein CbpA
VRARGGAATIDEARSLLGLAGGADARAIKGAYYQFAKQSHPDLHPGDETAAERFARAADACELLLTDLDRLTSGGDANVDAGIGRTGTREAARGEGGPSGAPAGARARRSVRVPTAAELICQRLEAEPEMTSAVWAELVRLRIELDSATMDSLFRACGGERRDEALRLFEAAAPRLSPETRRSAIVSLLSWCHEEASSDWTFAAVALVTSEDLTPEVRGALERTFSYFPSGGSW